MSERDTQFQGFARLLYEELARNTLNTKKGLSEVEAFKQEQHLIIAQCTYDLMYAILESYGGPIYNIFYSIGKIPDLTEWPHVIEEKPAPGIVHCAICGAFYEQDAPGWFGYQKRPGEAYAFCCLDHMQRWKKERGEL